MYDYPTKGITQASYPKEACQPWLHYNMRLGNLQIDATLAVGGTGTFGGVVTAPRFQGTINPEQSWKGFDIKHPNKSNHRFTYLSEGPEAGVYLEVD